ncbi:MAG: LPS export ABC transporter permease LptF [Pseudomonadales bacterium]
MEERRAGIGGRAVAVAARYVNRELVLMLIALTAVLLAVTVGGRFVSYLQEAALGKYEADSIVYILLFRLPGFLQLLLPFAWFLAVLLTLGRLHAEQELEVLKSGGVGPGRVVRWLTPVALLLTALVGYLSLILAPDNDRRLTEFFREQQSNAEFKVMTPGVFHTFYRGQRVTYADSVSKDNDALVDVFMAELSKSRDPVTIRAEQGGQQIDPATGGRYLVLINGHRYVGEPGKSDYHVVSFGRLRQRLEEGPSSRGLAIEARPTRELASRTDPEARAELQFRVALPLVVPIAGLIAIGIGRTKPRQGRFARVLPGLGVFVLYYAALVFSRDMVTDGRLPAMVGLWPVHGLFLAAGLLLLRQSALPAKI